MYFVSIQTVLEMHGCQLELASKCILMAFGAEQNAFSEHSKMHLFLSRIGNKCIQMVIWSTKNAFHEYSNSARKAFAMHSNHH